MKKKIIGAFVLSVFCLILIGSVAQASLTVNKVDARKFNNALKVVRAEQASVYKTEKQALNQVKKDAPRKVISGEVQKSQLESAGTSSEAVQCPLQIGNIQRGDMNRDGTINKDDVAFLLRVYGLSTGNVEPSFWNDFVQYADMDCNNQIDLSDLALELSKIN